MEDLTSKLTGILAGETSGDETNSEGVSSYAGADGGVPVTLVVSGGFGDRSHMVSHDGTNLLSTLALQGDDSSAATEATQFFLEQLAGGCTILLAVPCFRGYGDWRRGAGRLWRERCKHWPERPFGSN